MQVDRLRAELATEKASKPSDAANVVAAEARKQRDTITDLNGRLVRVFIAFTLSLPICTLTVQYKSHCYCDRDRCNVGLLHSCFEMPD